MKEVILVLKIALGGFVLGAVIGLLVVVRSLDHRIAWLEHNAMLRSDGVRSNVTP